ncbi:DUF11 domain-containing protein [Streptomyces sp. A7024]|uniref:DUF11 domain-containing protein n=1 Tax=Streptomyces coryli TaxID=1128680 RepID=A0A6G4UCR2_9ACTN|nr:DUF11 domain-containing protein [Streptomyces coryli]NGN70025.1 DUF11 domain-containing protein [Streptomyces coryli]
MANRSRTAAAGLALLSLGVTAGAPAQADRDDDPKARPPVTIDVRTADRTLSDGATATYTITVRNRTAKRLPNTQVTQLMPDSLRHVRSQPAGSADATGRQVTWRLRLAPGGEAKLTMTGRVGTPAEDAGSQTRVAPPSGPAKGADGQVVQAGHTVAEPERRGPRVSTTVCVRAKDKGDLLTCATASSPYTKVFWQVSRVHTAVSAAIALLIGVVGVVLLRRRRAAGDETTPTGGPGEQR